MGSTAAMVSTDMVLSAFPTSSYNGSNYWVDVVFATTDIRLVPDVASARSAGQPICGCELIVGALSQVTSDEYSPTSNVIAGQHRHSGPGGSTVDLVVPGICPDNVDARRRWQRHGDRALLRDRPTGSVLPLTSTAARCHPGDCVKAGTARPRGELVWS